MNGKTMTEGEKVKEQIDLSSLPGTWARLWVFCREYQEIGQTPDEREQARRMLYDLASRQISKEDFAFITDWSKFYRILAWPRLYRALVRAKIPLP